MYTSWPSSLVARTGLSFQDTLPYTGLGVDQVAPWSVDRVNRMLKPFMYTAYTVPFAGTTSMIGSNCPEPLHAHSGFAAPNVAPPSLLTRSEMWGVGQLPLQGFSTP